MFTLYTPCMYTPCMFFFIQTTVVVTQPAPVVYVKRYGSGDHFLVLSIVLSFISFFCGTWVALFCTIPAIFVALSVSELVKLQLSCCHGYMVQYQVFEWFSNTV